MSVYDRLTDKETYTGVYARRFQEGGGINSDSQLSLAAKDVFQGNTNTGSDMPIHDISQTFRPNLRHNTVPGQEQAEQLAPLDPAQVDPNAMTGDDVLQRVFAFYAAFGETAGGSGTMSNANFSKLTREAPGLLGRRVTPTDVDLVFVKSKPKSVRKINYVQFVGCMYKLALKRYHTLDEAGAFSRFLAQHLFKTPASPVAHHGSTTAGPGGAAPAALQPLQHQQGSPTAGSLVPPVPQQQQPQRGAEPEPLDPHERYQRQKLAGVTYAGEGIKQGSVYDRLTKAESFTGVYKNLRPGAGGRINGHADAGNSGVTSGYAGDTNTGTNEVIHEIGVLMRPNLQKGGSRAMRF